MKPRITVLAALAAIIGLLPGCAYISRASQSTTGVQGNSSSSFASLSADGRWVAFESFASNLVPGDTNGVFDVFVRDNQSAKTVRVSVRDDGMQGNGRSEFPSISDNGRRVVFASEATNLSAGDTNGAEDIYVHDRDTDGDGIYDEPGAISTTLMSVTSSGGAAPFGSSVLPEINGDGLGAVYQSTSALVPEDTNGKIDVYSTTLYSGIVPLTRLISKPAGAAGPSDGFSENASVNNDGSAIAFETTATNLVAGDTNGKTDVVLWDARALPLGINPLSRATGGVLADADNLTPSMSGDGSGRFVAFASAATNLVPGKTTALPEIYVVDRTTGTITAESRTPAGASANGPSVDPSISADGNRVSFESAATNLVASDANGQTDVFVRDRASDLTQIASTAHLLGPANGASQRSALSADGRYVAFDSGATNLVTPDANGLEFDVFTHTAVVPEFSAVTSTGTTAFDGAFEAAPRLHWGANTMHVSGKGFSPDVTVDLGAGLTISNIQRTPTDIVFDVDVPNGTSATTRNLSVENPGSAGVGGAGGTRVCSKCISIQRWTTVPDPVPGDRHVLTLLSNAEFTNATSSPNGIVWSRHLPNEILLLVPTLDAGDHDLTLDNTTSGTVTCTGCIHVP